jgi:hypothetical protein
MAILVGVAVGWMAGLGAGRSLFFVVLPIMAGGVGEGAIPLSVGYAEILGQNQGRMLAQLLGYALGRRLYIAYMQSRISRKEIHALFHDPLNTPLRPLECYKELTLSLWERVG